MNYGKALKIGRAIAGLQQKEVARLSNLDPSLISLIEKGKRRPSVGTIEKLSRSLNIPNHLFTLLATEPEDLKTTHVDELHQVGKSLVRLLLKNDAPSRSQSSRSRKTRAT